MEGNQMKTREALEFAVRHLTDTINDGKVAGNILYLAGCMKVVADKCRAALAEPPRNCDRFKTWTEARNAFGKWCCNLSWKISSCCECPHYSVRDGKLKHCFSRWLLASTNTEASESARIRNAAQEGGAKC